MKYKLRGNFSNNLNTVLDEILINRGVEEEKLNLFKNPNKEDCDNCAYWLDNIEDGVKQLLWHLENNKKICFVVDADADGYTSSAILWLYVRKVYPQANLFFTVHKGKQHGLSDKVDYFLKENYDLVICPDAASFDTEYQKILNDGGINILVIDHHIPPSNFIVEEIPKNTIVINNQLSEKYPNKTLCGAGMVYKFCQVLDDILQVNYADNFLDLVALGEISDVMTKTEIETNYLIEKGLKNIRNKGFQTLIESQSYSLKEKASFPYFNLNSIDIAFYISPLINAVTRVGSVAEREVMFYCFIEPNKEMASTKRGAKTGDIELAAEQTARIAKNVKSRQDKIKEKALELIDFKIQKEGLLENNILIIELEDSDNIPSELTGLIAGACVSKYNKPCLILRRNDEGFLRGSGRNNEHFKELPDLKSFLEESGYFEYSMGHANAQGNSIHKSKLDSFIKYSNEYFTEEAFDNCYLVDFILSAENNNIDLLLYELSKHPEYFGNGINEIEVIIKNVSLKNYLIMGQYKNHIKFTQNGVEYVRFYDEELINIVKNSDSPTMDVYGKISLNEWGGKVTPQCNISDYEINSPLNKYDF